MKHATYRGDTNNLRHCKNFSRPALSICALLCERSIIVPCNLLATCCLWYPIFFCFVLNLHVRSLSHSALDKQVGESSWCRVLCTAMTDRSAQSDTRLDRLLGHSVSIIHSHNAKLYEGSVVLENLIAPHSKSKEQKKHIKNKEISKCLILNFFLSLP